MDKYRMIDWHTFNWVLCRHIKHPHGSSPRCSIDSDADWPVRHCTPKDCPVWNNLRRGKVIPGQKKPKAMAELLGVSDEY